MYPRPYRPQAGRGCSWFGTDGGCVAVPVSGFYLSTTRPFDDGFDTRPATTGRSPTEIRLAHRRIVNLLLGRGSFGSTGAVPTREWESDGSPLEPAKTGLSSPNRRSWFAHFITLRVEGPTGRGRVRLPMKDTNRLERVGPLPTETLAPVVREAIVIFALVAFMGLGLFLPGTDQVLPGTDIAVADLIVAAGTVGIVGTLIWAGPAVRDLVESSLEGPSTVVADAAAVARYLLVFLAVLIAHWGLEAIIVPLLDISWTYDLIFFLLAVAPLAVIAYHVYSCLDPLTNFVMERLVKDDRDQSDLGDESRSA